MNEDIERKNEEIVELEATFKMLENDLKSLQADKSKSEKITNIINEEKVMAVSDINKLKKEVEKKEQKDVCSRVQSTQKNKNIALVLNRFFQLDGESNEQTNKLLDQHGAEWDYGEGMTVQPTGWIYACVMNHQEYLYDLSQKGFLEKFFLSIRSPQEAKYYFFNEEKKCIDSTDRDHDICHPFDCDAHGIEHLSVKQNKKDLFYNERIMPYTVIIECRTLDAKWRSLISIEALFHNLEELFGIFNEAFQEVKSN